jgi:hypothetical protein
MSRLITSGGGGIRTLGRPKADNGFRDRAEAAAIPHHNWNQHRGGMQGGMNLSRRGCTTHRQRSATMLLRGRRALCSPRARLLVLVPSERRRRLRAHASPRGRAALWSVALVSPTPTSISSARWESERVGACGRAFETPRRIGHSPSPCAYAMSRARFDQRVPPSARPRPAKARRACGTGCAGGFRWSSR